LPSSKYLKRTLHSLLKFHVHLTITHHFNFTYF
jgi:hypothetical protein